MINLYFKLKNWWLNSYIYLIFYYRPMHGKLGILKVLLYTTTSIIAVGSLFFTITSIQSIISYSPKTLENLAKQTGVIQKYHFNLKNSRGKLYLQLPNGDIQIYTIRSHDKNVYEELNGKKVKIYSTNDIPMLNNYIKQLEDENGNAYIKYSYEAELNSINMDIKIIKASIVCFFISAFLVFITNLKGPKPKYFKKG